MDKRNSSDDQYERWVSEQIINNQTLAQLYLSDSNPSISSVLLQQGLICIGFWISLSIYILSIFSIFTYVYEAIL